MLSYLTTKLSGFIWKQTVAIEAKYPFLFRLHSYLWSFLHTICVYLHTAFSCLYSMYIMITDFGNNLIYKYGNFIIAFNYGIIIGVFITVAIILIMLNNKETEGYNRSAIQMLFESSKSSSDNQKSDTNASNAHKSTRNRVLSREDRTTDLPTSTTNSTNTERGRSVFSLSWATIINDLSNSRIQFRFGGDGSWLSRWRKRRFSLHTKDDDADQDKLDKKGCNLLTTPSATSKYRHNSQSSHNGDNDEGSDNDEDGDMTSELDEIVGLEEYQQQSVEKGSDNDMSTTNRTLNDNQGKNNSQRHEGAGRALIVTPFGGIRHYRHLLPVSSGDERDTSSNVHTDADTVFPTPSELQHLREIAHINYCIECLMERSQGNDSLVYGYSTSRTLSYKPNFMARYLWQSMHATPGLQGGQKRVSVPEATEGATLWDQVVSHMPWTNHAQTNHDDDSDHARTASSQSLLQSMWQPQGPYGKVPGTVPLSIRIGHHILTATDFRQVHLAPHSCGGCSL